MNNPMFLIQQMMSMGKNPQQIVENFVRQNPQANQLLKSIQNSGLSPQQYLDQYAKQNNCVDQVNQIKSMLNGYGKR